MLQKQFMIINSKKLNSLITLIENYIIMYFSHLELYSNPFISYLDAISEHFLNYLNPFMTLKPNIN